MEVPTEDEAAAAENAPEKTVTVATHGKKAPVEKALTGGKVASMENIAASDPGGKKAHVQNAVVGKKGASMENTTAVTIGGKKAPSGKKAPMQ
jgi:hypothetical protein